MENLSCFSKQASLVGLLGVALFACADGVDEETNDPQVQVVESVETATLDAPYITMKKGRCLGIGGVVSTSDARTRKACKALGGTGEVCVSCESPGCSPTTVCIIR